MTEDEDMDDDDLDAMNVTGILPLAVTEPAAPIEKELGKDN